MGAGEYLGIRSWKMSLSTYLIEGLMVVNGYLAEKFLKKYCSYPELSRLPYRNLPVVTTTRRWLAISAIISK